MKYVHTDNKIFPYLIKHKMHEKTGDLLYLYESSKRKYHVVVAYHRKVPVGVVVCDNSNLTNTYVRPEFRRRGVALQLIKELRTHKRGVLVGNTGYGNFLDFYNRAGILWASKYTFIPKHWWAMFGDSAAGKYRSHVKRNFHNMRKKMDTFAIEKLHIEAIGGTYWEDGDALLFNVYDGIITGRVDINHTASVQLQASLYSTITKTGKLKSILLKRQYKFCHAQNEKARAAKNHLFFVPSIHPLHGEYLVFLKHDNKVFLTDIVSNGDVTYDAIMAANREAPPKSRKLVAKNYNDVFGSDMIIRTAPYIGEDASSREIKFLATQPELNYVLERK